MNNLQKVALEKAVSFLKAGKFNYAITDDEGNKWGDLEVVTPKTRTRSPLKYPMGTVRNHYINAVENLKKDDAVAIDCANFSPLDLQANFCAWATNNWGKGNYTTNVDRKSNQLLIFRLG